LGVLKDNQANIHYQMTLIYIIHFRINGQNYLVILLVQGAIPSPRAAHA